METAKQVQMLQMAYAGALADTVLQFSKEGVLERVTERKHREQLATGNSGWRPSALPNRKKYFSSCPNCLAAPAGKL